MVAIISSPGHQLKCPTGDVRAKLFDPVGIEAVVTLIKDSSQSSELRQAAISGILAFSGYGKNHT